MFDIGDKEAKCEGRKVLSIVYNLNDLIIRFTDGSAFTVIDGVADFREAK